MLTITSGWSPCGLRRRGADTHDGDGHQRVRGNAKVEVESAVETDRGAASEGRGEESPGESMILGADTLQPAEEQNNGTHPGERRANESALREELKMVVLGVLDTQVTRCHLEAWE